MIVDISEKGKRKKFHYIQIEKEIEKCWKKNYGMKKIKIKLI